MLCKLSCANYALKSTIRTIPIEKKCLFCIIDITLPNKCSEKKVDRYAICVKNVLFAQNFPFFEIVYLKNEKKVL